MKRLGIFGGTFDPPHNGHVHFAEAATKELELQKLLFVPSHMTPHKETGGATAAERLHMVEFLVNMSASYELCDKEFQRGGPSYTIDTLLGLRREYPTARFFLLIGADNIATFPSWHRWEEIIQMVTVVVMKRQGASTYSFPPETNVHILDQAEVNVSSTLVRELVKKGLPISQLVPNEVQNYIQEKKIYLV